MIERKEASYKPTLASPPRRVLHAIIALAGWLLFGYWWWLVARRVSAQEVRFTFILIAIALVVIVAVTAAWAAYNVRLFQSRGARTKLREVPLDFSNDTLGRAVRLPVGDVCRTAAVVNVSVEGKAKIYTPSAAVTGAGARP